MRVTQALLAVFTFVDVTQLEHMLICMASSKVTKASKATVALTGILKGTFVGRSLPEFSLKCM